MAGEEDASLYVNDIIFAVFTPEAREGEWADFLQSLSLEERDKYIRRAKIHMRWADFDILGKLTELGVVEAETVCKDLIKSSPSAEPPEERYAADVAHGYQLALQTERDPVKQANLKRLHALSSAVAAISTAYAISEIGQSIKPSNAYHIGKAREMVDNAEPYFDGKVLEILNREIENIRFAGSGEN